MLKTESSGNKRSGVAEVGAVPLGSRCKRLALMAAGLGMGLLFGPNHSASPNQGVEAKFALQPPAALAAPLPEQIRLENPCHMPPRSLNTVPNGALLPDIYSENPLLACLAELPQECWDVGNPQGGNLCINYGMGSVFEENDNTYIGLYISVDGAEFYEYTMHVPLDECETAVAALKAHVQLKFDQLPAAGDLHKAPNQVQVGGWLTDCLPDERSAELLNSSREPLS